MLQMGIQPEKRGARKNDMGVSVFPETDPIFFTFRFPYIPFVTYRDEYRVTRGVISPDLYQNQVLHINVYKSGHGVLHHLLAMRPADILRPFLSDNRQLTRKLIFSKGVFS